MCNTCHTDLERAKTLINTALDRHMRSNTTTDLQLGSEAIRDAAMLDRHLADSPMDKLPAGVELADAIAAGGAFSGNPPVRGQAKTRQAALETANRIQAHPLLMSVGELNTAVAARNAELAAGLTPKPYQVP